MHVTNAIPAGAPPIICTHQHKVNERHVNACKRCLLSNGCDQLPKDGARERTHELNSDDILVKAKGVRRSGDGSYDGKAASAIAENSYARMKCSKSASDEVRLGFAAKEICKNKPQLCKRLPSTTPDTFQKAPKYGLRPFPGPSEADLASERGLKGEVMRSVPPCDTPKGTKK